jgi:amino acid permease
MSQNKGQTRRFSQRAFGKLDKGSLRGSIFALSATAIGSGVLSLPYVLGLNGWVLGLFFLLVGAFAAAWSLFMIAESAIKANVKNLSILSNLVGGKKLERFLQINLLVYLFGCCISYQIIISALLARFLKKCGAIPEDDYAFFDTWQYRAMQAIPTAMIVLFPLSMIKDMSGFRHISVVSIFALIYTGIVLICELPEYIKAYRSLPDVEIELACFDWNFFTGASITFFAYNCHVQILPIFSELVNPNERRIKKIAARSIFIDTLFYVTIALAGYFATYNKTPKIVLDRSLPGDDTPDPFVMVAQLGIVMVLFVAVPMNYSPFRNQVFYVFFGRDNFSQKENIVCTGIFTAVTCFLAIVFPDVSSVLGILGGLNATSIQFLVPMICSIKVSGQPVKAPRNIIKILFFGFLCLVGYTNVGTTIYRIVSGHYVIGRGPDNLCKA